MTMVTLRGHSL